MSHGPETPSETVRHSAGKSNVREWLETIVAALLLAWLIRAFVVQVYLVEGPSMHPTLHTGERLVVNKFIYYFRGPKPGEIIVLKDPSSPDRELIKRVVAVAGDTVAIREGVTYVNGKAVREPFITPLMKEENTPEVKVPEGHVFVMGDNRPNSADSRSIGAIPNSNVDGKAFFLFWPLNRLGQTTLDQPYGVETVRS